MESKVDLLNALKQEMESDHALSLVGSANLVFGEGDAEARVMFIGEAPGRNEDLLKRPFVGRAGKLLDEALKEIGWPRESIYITNIVNRRPPDNRDPFPDEIEAYKPYLTRQIEIINPSLIATLGRFSMNYFAPSAKISRDHGQPMRINSRVIMPLYHPAAALRSTAMMNEFKKDFKKLPAVLRKVLSLESAK